MIKPLTIAAIITCLSACANVGNEQSEGLDLFQNVCTEPRPEICTREYRPVCAQVKTDQGVVLKTYATGCTACGDSQVLAYQDEACK
jgi:hypothetical protein